MKTLSFGNKDIICISIRSIKEPTALLELVSG